MREILIETAALNIIIIIIIILLIQVNVFCRLVIAANKLDKKIDQMVAINGDRPQIHVHYGNEMQRFELLANRVSERLHEVAFKLERDRTARIGQQQTRYKVEAAQIRNGQFVGSTVYLQRFHVGTRVAHRLHYVMLQYNLGENLQSLQFETRVAVVAFFDQTLNGLDQIVCAETAKLGALF